MSTYFPFVGIRFQHSLIFIVLFFIMLIYTTKNILSSFFIVCSLVPNSRLTASTVIPEQNCVYQYLPAHV